MRIRERGEGHPRGSGRGKRREGQVWGLPGGHVALLKDPL